MIGLPPGTCSVSMQWFSLATLVDTEAQVPQTLSYPAVEPLTSVALFPRLVDQTT